MAEESRMAVVDRTFDAMVGVKIYALSFYRPELNAVCAPRLCVTWYVTVTGPADHNKYVWVQDVEERSLPAMPRNFSRVTTVRNRVSEFWTFSH